MSGPIQLVNLLLSLAAFALIARWYILPRLHGISRARALQPFLLLHSFRHIGLMFLAPGAVKTDLPNVFAQYAGYGDLAASVLAFLALLAIRCKWPIAMFLVWVFNIEGTIDLVTSISLGVANDDASGMGAVVQKRSRSVMALIKTTVLKDEWMIVEQKGKIERGAIFLTTTVIIASARLFQVTLSGFPIKNIKDCP